MTVCVCVAFMVLWWMTGDEDQVVMVQYSGEGVCCDWLVMEPGVSVTQIAY